MSSRGFTLIELIMVIVIIGILAAVAIPKYVDLQNKAEISAEKGVLAAVRSAIVIYHSEGLVNGLSSANAWPQDLEATGGPASISSAGTQFEGILEHAIDDNWSEVAANQYTGPTGTTTYTYSPVTGRFE